MNHHANEVKNQYIFYLKYKVVLSSFSQICENITRVVHMELFLQLLY